jgi:hypothetical protein
MPKTTPDPNETTKKARRWAASPEGRRAMRQALSSSRKTATALEKARKVDPESVHKPFTV